MSYIGNTAQNINYVPAIDYFNGDGSTVAFTLSRPVASVAAVQAVISNVPQNPGSAFTVSGSTITFTSAPPSGTNNVYVYYTSPNTSVATISQNPVIIGNATIDGLTVGKGGGEVSTNTAVGASALAATSTDGNNTALGYQSLTANTSGYGNTGVGQGSLSANVGGYSNTAVGKSSLAATTSGAANTALGRESLYSNTTASNNTAVGFQAGYSNTGAENTAVGYQAGYATSSGAYNVSVGLRALYLNTTGQYNTAIGYTAGYSSNYNGVACNTFIGNYAGYSLTSGIGNTFVGSGTAMAAGSAMTTGSKNTILGAYNGNTDSLDIRTASNYVVLSDGDGNRAAFWQSGGGWVQKNNSTSWSTFSDQRIKENVVNIDNGLEVISALRPVEFDYIQTGKHDIGFIAQEYQTVLPEQVDKQTGIDDATKELVNDDHILSVQQNLVPYLVAAIKELNAKVDAQAAEIAALKGAA